MPPLIQRTVAVVLSAALLCLSSGCHTTKLEKVEVSAVKDPAQEQIVGVTLKDGREVGFDPPGGIVRNGVIEATVRAVPFTTALADVDRIWLERQEVSTTRTVGLSAAIIAGVAVVVAGIALATKGSCPFVYSWDGTRYVFEAEPYGGAITRGLERDDYTELKQLRATDGVYRLLLTNEVDETQYTNLLELWVVDHAPGLRVFSDEFGQLRGHATILPPRAAHDRYGKDVLPWVASTDRKIWEPEAVAGSDGSLRQELVLTFDKPPDTTQANLIVNAATGLWGSYMIKKSLELRGREAPVFLAALDHDLETVKAVHAWSEREETYRLRIEVEEPTGWETRGSLLGSGPFIAAERAIPLDISRVPGDALRMRVRPPVGFWAFNSFAVAYGPGAPVTVTPVAMTRARTSDGQDVAAAMSAVDNDYYRMPHTTDRAEITFEAPSEKPGMERQVFLHARGWYALHLRGDGEPDRVALSNISSTPGGAAQFAVEQYVLWREGTGATR